MKRWRSRDGGCATSLPCLLSLDPHWRQMHEKREEKQTCTSTWSKEEKSSARSHLLCCCPVLPKDRSRVQVEKTSIPSSGMHTLLRVREGVLLRASVHSITTTTRLRCDFLSSKIKLNFFSIANKENWIEVVNSKWQSDRKERNKWRQNSKENRVNEWHVMVF